jgi:hypothetical protein
MSSLNKRSNDNDNHHPSPMPLFKPEHQNTVLELISSAGRGDGSKAARIWSRLFPSKADRAMAANEASMVETKGKMHRQLANLMGQALYEDAKARLATQHQMVTMTLNRQLMEWYVKESNIVHQVYSDDILAFCSKFIELSEQFDGYPESLKQEAVSRLETSLYEKLMSLDDYLRNFEQSARQKLKSAS